MMRSAAVIVVTFLLASAVADKQNELEIPVIPIVGCGEHGLADGNAACRLDGVVGQRTVVTLPARYVVHAVSITLEETNGEYSVLRIYHSHMTSRPPSS